MVRIFKNFKLKRIISILLVFLTLFFCIIQSLTVANAADSNDRRKAWISLAKGKQKSEASELIDGMTIDDLRCVALYLSNFYKTWDTRLNIEMAEATDENTSSEDENTEYNGVSEMMTKALKDYCGFDEDMARYLTTLSLTYDVSTRTPLYIRKDHFRALWIYYGLANTSSLAGGQEDYTGDQDNYNDIDDFDASGQGKGSVGFLGHAYFTDKSLTQQESATLVRIQKFDEYCKWLCQQVAGSDNITGADGKEYVPLTYPIFLSALDASYRISCHDTVAEHELWEKYIDTEYIRRADLQKSHDEEEKDDEVRDAYTQKCETKYIPFYWMDKDKNTKIAFSNNNECMKMYALLNDNLNYNKGMGNAFLAGTKDEIKAIIRNASEGEKADTVLKCTAFGQVLYTNWIGDILLDNKLNLYTVFPGCANPYMLTRISDDDPTTYNTDSEECTSDSANQEYVLGNRLNLVNVFALINSNKLSKTSGTAYVTYATNPDGSKKKREGTLFEVGYFRDSPGSEASNWDKDYWDIFSDDLGSTEDTIIDKLNSASFVGKETTWGEDYITFPSLHHIITSTSLTWWGGSNAVAARNGLDRLGNANYFHSGSSGHLFWRTDNYGHSSYLNGCSRSNNEVLVANNLAGFQPNSNLSTYFEKGDILDTYSDFKKLDAGEYTSINDTEIKYDKGTKKFFQPLFLTYCFAYFNASTNDVFKEDTNVINLKMQLDQFPKGDSAAIDWNAMTLSTDTTSEEVLSFVYYLLHPVEGAKYVSTWIKNKLSGIFIGWHEDIVGSSDSNSSLGMTQYLGFSGYVTTPNLHDISWVDSLLTNYNSFIVYILILMAVILLAYVIVGQLTIQRAIIGFVMFGFFAFLPPIFMNVTIDFTNTTCDSIYSKKFNYWAIVQTEEYLNKLDMYKEASKEGDSSEIMATLLALNSTSGDIESETSYTGMRVKWVSPKKFNDMAELSESMQESPIAKEKGVLQTMVINSIQASTSGESYLTSDNALFFYRDILDIYRYGATSYNIYSDTAKIQSASWADLTLRDFADDKVTNIVQKKWCNNNSTSFTISSSDAIKTQSTLLSFFDDSNATVKTRGNNVTYKLSSDRHNCLYYRIASNAGTTLTNANNLAETSGLQAMKLGFINNKFSSLDTTTNYYTKHNLANTLLATFNETYQLIGIHNIAYDNIRSNTIDCSKTALASPNNWTSFKNKSLFAEFPQSFNYTLQSLQGSIDNGLAANFSDLSSFYYGLYSESPYYFMNYEFRDILNADTSTGYYYDVNNLTEANEDGANTNAVISKFLKNNQEYFYNYKDGDGYGELKDFMNMHDFFYYVIPTMKPGIQLIRKFDNDFNFKTFDTCPLRLQPDGSFKYNSETIIDAKGNWVGSKGETSFWADLTDQQRYEFWHDLNVNLLSYYCCSWLDTMYDCNYAKPEKIEVGKESFIVQDPLNPMSYYTTDDKGNVVKGRYMVFSRSEMAYYGLKLQNLTTVEQKIIEMQDNVYKNTLQLTNYYNLSSETLIHNYALIQLFEFNKEFSQESALGNDYILYPQGYELKATSYDGYLRLILNGSTGESLMTSGKEGNTSIYQRIMGKTSIFFGIVLVVNDFVAVYVIPALKLFFLVLLFFLSIAIIISCAIKVEMNMAMVFWKSILSPMLKYAGVSIGMAWLVSLFMSNGANGVTQSGAVIKLGDPTMTLLVMLIINTVVVVLYWKICKGCFKDFKQYASAVFNGALGALAGAASKIVGTVTGKNSTSRAKGDGGGYSTPEQRGADNNPSNGKSGLLAAAGGAVAGAVAANAETSPEKEADKDARSKERADRYTPNENKAIQRADKDVEKKRAQQSATKEYEKHKTDILVDKLDKKQAKIDAKRNALKNNNANGKNDKRLKRLDKQESKIYNKLEKREKKEGRANQRAMKRTDRAKLKSEGLRSSGMNRYKLAEGAKEKAKKGAKGVKTGVKKGVRVTSRAIRNRKH